MEVANAPLIFFAYVRGVGFEPFKFNEEGENMKRTLVTLLGVIVFASGVVAAHEGEDHTKNNKVMGTVTAVDVEKGSLEIKVKDGKPETIALDKSTKVMKGDKTAAIGDIAVGTKVVVTLMDHSGMKMAMVVRLPAAKTEPAPAK